MSESAFFLRRMNDHIQYLGKLKATLEDRGDFQGSDHHACKLGQWLDSDGPAQSSAISEEARAVFDSLLEPHQRFHQASKLALDHKRAGDKENMEHAMTEMFKLSAILVDILMKLDTMSH
ncbi:MAG: CZB domain-containing protein [Candidatus Thiodiazotropha sp. (ex Lucinoma annulata)]|nr:CZB domain-containing protein [Candidatus Thiodiazotropha sp. (ex Lucinoma borealis)]MCU7841990.1 CZB domain-containing protein [Candidatus Thiodiazotropha sp. (ex Troendleina suluensis)]MCU7885249.1 CZB domain-containing protein [Candidatus Thiodiazotropha sp. (ex Lucinoma annulata)]MCU7854846.1 CZB domain-containing protein [Candidatus Thiodiazotropha sp. (ex Lucinoma borealis)]MCU7864924.1 CZB domain-containing protein [Candidatus Thiodiazotropha sp. (ex Lucinoma borealis)]